MGNGYLTGESGWTAVSVTALPLLLLVEGTNTNIDLHNAPQSSLQGLPNTSFGCRYFMRHTSLLGVVE